MKTKKANKISTEQKQQFTEDDFKARIKHNDQVIMTDKIALIDLDFSIREHDLKIEEYEISKNNPVDYSKTDEWKIWYKKWAEFNIEHLRLKKQQRVNQMDSVKVVYDKQIKDCEEDNNLARKEIERLKKGPLKPSETPLKAD